LVKLIDSLALTPKPKKRAGDKLASYTQGIHAVRIRHHVEFGDRLVFVDTPGFDDSERSDMEILKMIGEWLRKT